MNISLSADSSLLEIDPSQPTQLRPIFGDYLVNGIFLIQRLLMPLFVILYSINILN